MAPLLPRGAELSSVSLRSPAGMARHAALIFGAALFVLPFIWPLHTRPMTSFYNEWAAAVLLILSCAALCVPPVFSSSQQRELRIPKSALIFAPLVVVMWVQWAMNVFASTSDFVFPMWVLLLASCAVVLGRSLVREFGLARIVIWLAWAGIVGALINIGMQTLQLLVANDWPAPHYLFRTRGQLLGAVGQVNNLATYIAWATIGVLYLWAARKISFLAALLLVVLFFSGLTLTGSRTSWLQIGWIGVMGAWLLYRAKLSNHPQLWRAVLCLPLLYVFISLVLPLLLSLFDLSLGRTGLMRLVAQTGDPLRLQLLREGGQLIMDHPWLGIGHGQLMAHQYQLLDHASITLFATSVHNGVVDLFVFFGVLAAVPCIVLTLSWLRRAVSAQRSVERIALWLMLAVFGIHALLELPHHYTYFILPVAFMVGMLETGDFVLARPRVLSLLAAVLVAGGLFLCGKLLVEYRQIERFYVKYYLGQRFATTVNEQALKEVAAYHHDTWFDGPANFLLCYNFALNANALPQKLTITEEALGRLPEPNIIYRYVILLALDGRPHEGFAHLGRMKKMFPAAFDDVAAELERLAGQQPEIFGALHAHATHLSVLTQPQ